VMHMLTVRCGIYLGRASTMEFMTLNYAAQSPCQAVKLPKLPGCQADQLTHSPRSMQHGVRCFATQELPPLLIPHRI
jgi:hypothetical protein